MKNMFKISSFSLLLAVVVFSCAKDEHRVVFESSTNPVLTASSTNDMVLNINNKDAVAEIFNWTNPTYRFNTGISSQDVTYTLQFDTAGKNFTSPGKQERSIGTDLSVTLTVKDLNSFLSKMELTAGKTYNTEFRIKSTLVAGTVPLYSNVIKMKITPYLDYAVEPPGTGPNYDDGNLWATGDCFPSPDWANPLPSPYDVSLKFTKIDKLHYVLIATFDHSGGYKLIQAQGVWSTQYHALVANTASGGDFEKKDSDPQFASPGVGTYKIEVNFQTGKYKVSQP